LIYCPVNEALYPILLANRSAVLYELELYSLAKIDVNEAMARGYPSDKMDRLVARSKRIDDNLEEALKDTSTEFNDKIAYAFRKISKMPSILHQISRKIKMRMEVPTLNINEPTYVHPALRVTNIKGMGRGIIVNEKVPRGTLLLKELPFDFAMDSDIFNIEGLACHYCGVRNVLRALPCPDCATSWYCSEVCKAGDQHRHKLSTCGIPEIQFLPALGRLAYQLYSHSKEKPPVLEKVLKVENENKFPTGTVKEGFYQGMVLLKQYHQL
jgi:hypothetical protein